MKKKSYKRFKDIVKKTIAMIRQDYQQYPDDTLCNRGAIFYMNGNDSTRLDWIYNNRLCEFILFHRNSKCGFIKLCVNSDGTANAYIYSEHDQFPAETRNLGEIMTPFEALEFAALMCVITDDKLIWNQSIDQLNWNAYEMDVQMNELELLA